MKDLGTSRVFLIIKISTRKTFPEPDNVIVAVTFLLPDELKPKELLTDGNDTLGILLLNFREKVVDSYVDFSSVIPLATHLIKHGFVKYDQLLVIP